MSPDRIAKYLAIFSIVFGAVTASQITFVASSLGQPGGIYFNAMLIALGVAYLALGILALRKVYWAYFFIAALFIPQFVQFRTEEVMYAFRGAIHLSFTLHL